MGLNKLRKDSRIEHIDDERGIGNGIIITLKPGIYFYDDCGVIGVDTVRDAYQEMRWVK